MAQEVGVAPVHVGGDGGSRHEPPGRLHPLVGPAQVELDLPDRRLDVGELQAGLVEALVVGAELVALLVELLADARRLRLLVVDGATPRRDAGEGALFAAGLPLSIINLPSQRSSAPVQENLPLSKHSARRSPIRSRMTRRCSRLSGVA